MNKHDFDWFDLDNYSGLNDLDLLGWQTQIIIRQIINSDLTQDFDEYIEKIKTKPVFDVELEVVGDDGELEDYSSGFKLDEEYPFNTFSVRSASVRHMVGRVMPDGECMNPMKMPYDLRGHTEGTYSLDANVIIDLTATDEQIKRDFNHWLVTYREKLDGLEIKKNFTKQDYSNWIKWRLIPYLDLKLISMYENTPLTLVDIASKIYCDEFDVDIVERVRRTTKPKAEWLISGTTELAMEAQLIALGTKT